MKSVFVVWKDSEDGMWHPVAKLTRLKEGYRFNYTQGAMHPNFIPLPKMNDLSKVYRSPELFSFFSNRLLPTNRPEFKKMLKWSDIQLGGYDELDLLGISGGARKTDQFRIISEPKINNDGTFKIRFFINGVRHLDSKGIERLSTLESGESLLFLFDNDNKHDCNAVLVSSKDRIRIGYCPKYFNCDVRVLLENVDLKSYSLNVVRINRDAPDQFKVLCEFVTEWPKGFSPFISRDYLAHTLVHA